MRQSLIRTVLIMTCAVAALNASAAPAAAARSTVPGTSTSGAAASDSVAEMTATFTGLDGKSHHLRELRGHPAVVNFWATWCGPCKEETPRLQKLADGYAARGIQFVAISLDGPDTRSRIGEVVQKRGLRMPVWTGASEQTLADLKMGELVPATLILDEDGEAIGRIEGEARDKDIRTRMDWLLNGRKEKQPKPVQKNDW